VIQVSHPGEILSVLAALVWAFSVVLFRLSGRSYAPLALNHFKNTVALILLLATMAILRADLLRAAPIADYVLLALSGILGIAIADTLFFRSLNLVGAGLSQVVSLAYSPFVILFTFMFLNERLSLGDLGGALLILSSILLTSGHEPPPGVTRHDLHRGLGIATLAVALMAAGVALAKPALDRSPVMWATTVRLIAGLVALSVFCVVSPRHRAAWAALRPSRSWKVALPAAILGAYLAMIIWIAGIKYTQASTAAILNQTSAIFVLPIAALVLREPITARKLAAVALAIAGVVLVTLT
jgi:drug/metabolite transporter (DMT)-like permease